jgi:hypothetical protein
MSFSGNVKEELVRQMGKSRHCQIAELAAIIAFIGKVSRQDEEELLLIETENTGLAKKFLTLVKTLFGYEVELRVSALGHLNKNRSCQMLVHGSKQVVKILQAVKILNEQAVPIAGEELVNGLIVQNTCCKRAFLRGAFLSAGSMSDPEKSYHFEIVCSTNQKAVQLQGMMNSFDLEAKIVERKNHFVVYLKEGSQIVDILNVMEAHKALMDLENVRIMKNMRNNVNRQVNCETANINKTVNAAVRQIEDIRYIESEIGLEKLPPALRQMAQLRLEYPEAALAELGTLSEPPVGKSGVNHRLRKIGEVADELRTKGN